jgi:hypothetical protein
MKWICEMTDRKFTPPTEFPAEYVTSDGLKAVILGPVPDDKYPLAGYLLSKCGEVSLRSWTADGMSFHCMESVSDLHDIPEKQVHWANDYGGFFGCDWFDIRNTADVFAGRDRIAVIRREWVEGQPPQYFTEEV